MKRHKPTRMALLAWVSFALLASPWVSRQAQADQPNRTNLTVVVTDHETGKPIFQARLTLQFRERHQGRSKLIAFNAKSNLQGRYKFSLIPMETIRLIVTAEHHQTFSKEFAIQKTNQVIEIKLKKPQPLL